MNCDWGCMNIPCEQLVIESSAFEEKISLLTIVICTNPISNWPWKGYPWNFTSEIFKFATVLTNCILSAFISIYIFKLFSVNFIYLDYRTLRVQNPSFNLWRSNISHSELIFLWVDGKHVFWLPPCFD